MAAKPRTVGRRFADITQTARGRIPFRYEFEIIPYCVAEVPSGHERVLFVWERGTKLFVTDPEAVNPKTRVVFWKQFLRQTITVYRAGNSIVKKEYTFKIQSVKDLSDGEQERTTIGKAQIDLAVYCTGQLDPQPQELFLQLKPHGKLKVSIKASWLKDAKIDADAMTEASGPTEEAFVEEAGQYFDTEPYNEQDLSGFDPDGPSGEPRSGRGHRASRSRNAGRGGHAAINDGGSGDSSAPQENGNGHHHRAPRKGGGGGKDGHSKTNGRGGGSDDQYDTHVQLSREPDDMRRIQEVDNEHEEGCAQQDADEYDRMVAEITAQVRTEVEPVQSGATFCCCFRSKHKISVDVQEVASLLNKQQGRQMSHSRQI